MTSESVPPRDDRRELLRADCRKCFGLCCVALSFTRSADFALNKEASEPCENLQSDFSCGIHGHLRPSGFRGCTVFDCFGAGQKVAQEIFHGRSWADAPESQQQMFAVFPVMRELHELLWYLSEALEMEKAAGLRPELAAAFDATTQLTGHDADALVSLDLNRHRDDVVRLLARVSQMVRADVPGTIKQSKTSRTIGPRANLMGANLAEHDLRGANLRGAYLIAADLHGADLRWADLIGVDLRDANLAGTDLSEALFLTQPQVSSAKGDATTLLPNLLTRPTHWNATA